MFRSLTWKLILSFILVASIAIALLALFIRLTSVDRLTQLIVDQQRSALETTLSSYYAEKGSWDGVAVDWQALLPQNPREQSNAPQGNPLPQDGQLPKSGDGPPDRNRRNFFGLADANGMVIVSVDPAYPVGSNLSSGDLQTSTPVKVDGKTVGVILNARQPPAFNPAEDLFLRRLNTALVFAGLGALFVALLMGLLLARTLTHPLQALTHAAQNITRGQLEQQVKVRSNDEIGQLAVAFNSMSQEVARVNAQRRQMTADIAHDLRTPLTVISGYIESMRDGVLKPTPQRFDLIYAEIERLQNLVGDLSTLSLADSGEIGLNLQAIPPAQLLERAAGVFRHQAEGQGISISVEAGPDLPEARLDEARMMQVLGNLISNSLRYTPPGGQIILSAQVYNGAIELCVSDTGTGIPEEELPLVFNRFHRADKSRHTEMGESGLGLSIVKALIEIHGGKVSAESRPGKGTMIRMLFPI
jgi:two-component system, OmpR family, sensor histidine kinase BaeS